MLVTRQLKTQALKIHLKTVYLSQTSTQMGLSNTPLMASLCLTKPARKMLFLLSLRAAQMLADSPFFL